MKYVSLILFLFLCFNIAQAQNLVPNPNFALHDVCPADWGEIEKCKYWYNASSATPDYFDTCHDTIAGSPHTVGIPNNASGTQSSTSSAYIGIGVFSSTANYREYAGVNIPPLVKGAKYRVLLVVSLADDSYYATNAPSVFFYKDRDTVQFTHFNLLYNPQITFTNAGYISDKVNWVTVIDTFVADSTYSHLIVGNFNNDASTGKIIVSPPGIGWGYYYIDSISVEKIADPSFVAYNTVDKITATLSPNPFSENTVLNIEHLPEGICNMSIINIQGIVVKEIDYIKNGQTNINRNGLPSGFYYLQLRLNGNKILIQKMIVY